MSQDKIPKLAAKARPDTKGKLDAKAPQDTAVNTWPVFAKAQAGAAAGAPATAAAGAGAAMDEVAAWIKLFATWAQQRGFGMLSPSMMSRIRGTIRR